MSAVAVETILVACYESPAGSATKPSRGGEYRGPALVAKSPADGYTLLVNTSAQAYSAALLKNLPYDPLKDFIPVAPRNCPGLQKSTPLRVEILAGYITDGVLRCKTLRAFRTGTVPRTGENRLALFCPRVQ